MLRSGSRGITLVEVAVLIVVVGLLLVLLISWLGSDRDRGARRATCMNNQQQFSLALLQYEGARGHLPGYRERVGNNATSWVVPLFPYLERTDLYRIWRDAAPGEPDGPDFAGRVFLRVMVCPSDPPEHTRAPANPLSYVVNCGLPGDTDTPADGLFFNQAADAKPATVSLAHIPDGSQSTLMLSENVQAGNWTDTDEADVGMVWHREPDECSPINGCVDAGDRPQDVRYARPSSHHADGVVVSFCDGHLDLREDIDYRVYQHLMTPDSAAARVPGELRESDY